MLLSHIKFSLLNAKNLINQIHHTLYKTPDFLSPFFYRHFFDRLIYFRQIYLGGS